MARRTSRTRLVRTIATSVRAASRPGSPSMAERAGAVPRMLSAVLRGEYRGTSIAHVALLAAAALYVVSPVDLVPEALLSVAGVTDDAIVAAWLVAALVNDTEAFLEWEQTVGSPRRAPRDFAHDEGSRSSRAADSRPGPQDMSAQEWARARTVRGQVVG